MIGAGVFTNSGYSMALGSPERVVWTWIPAGMIVTAGAFSYGQLIKAMPESGDEYLFLSHAAHPLPGFNGPHDWPLAIEGDGSAGSYSMFLAFKSTIDCDANQKRDGHNRKNDSNGPRSSRSNASQLFR